MSLKEDLEKSIADLQAALAEPELTPTARKRIQIQLDEALTSLASLTVGEETPDILLTHPDVWDEQGRLVNNALIKS